MASYICLACQPTGAASIALKFGIMQHQYVNTAPMPTVLPEPKPAMIVASSRLSWATAICQTRGTQGTNSPSARSQVSGDVATRSQRSVPWMGAK